MPISQSPQIPLEDLMGENQPATPVTVPQGEVDDAFAILRGEGVGEHTLDFEALQGEGYFERLMETFRDYLDPNHLQGQVVSLVNAAYNGGQINQQQAISELMSKAGMSYDEAENYIKGWDETPGFVRYYDGQGGVGADGTSFDDMLNALFGDLGGGGGGGGGGGYRSAAPVYSGPDKGLVSDWVKSKLVSLVGSADESRVATLTEKYFDADRRAFGGAEEDPKQTILEDIRNFEDYKRIHANRTDMDDEDTWISGQYAQLMSAGVSGNDAEQLAINFAQAGVSKERAGELSEMRRVGQQPTKNLPGFFQKVQQSMYTVSRSLR